MYGQTFEFHDLATIAVLIMLEGVLSIDNALVLGLLARRVPKDLQKRALTYGLIGAFAFRFIAIATATFLLKWTIAKLLGGLYLLWISAKYFFIDDKHGDAQSKLNSVKAAGFWQTVLVIELTDIAFAVDSILAAVGVVGDVPPREAGGAHPKLWVILVGGFLGVVLMRYAAVLFIKLLEKFPRLETSAYLLVLVIGGKLLAEWYANKPEQPPQLHFHSIYAPEFWAFWVTMAICFVLGFFGKSEHSQSEHSQAKPE